MRDKYNNDTYENDIAEIQSVKRSIDITLDMIDKEMKSNEKILDEVKLEFYRDSLLKLSTSIIDIKNKLVNHYEGHLDPDNQNASNRKKDRADLMKKMAKPTNWPNIAKNRALVANKWWELFVTTDRDNKTTYQTIYAGIKPKLDIAMNVVAGYNSEVAKSTAVLVDKHKRRAAVIDLVAKKMRERNCNDVPTSSLGKRSSVEAVEAMGEPNTKRRSVSNCNDEPTSLATKRSREVEATVEPNAKRRSVSNCNDEPKSLLTKRSRREEAIVVPSAKRRSSRA